jgi:phage-related protein
MEGFATVFEIDYYRTERGLKPVEEFIDSLDMKMQVKIFRQISLLKEFGSQLGEPYSKQLVNGIFELRIQQSNNITRILYFFIRGRKVILTHGFTKKTPKTPPGEIERALMYRAEYESRKDENE